MTCPRNYSENVPISCRLYCPIARGQNVARRGFTVTQAAQHPESPLYEKRNEQAIMNLVQTGCLIRVESSAVTWKKSRQGRKVDKVIPLCALIAYATRNVKNGNGQGTFETNPARDAIQILAGMSDRERAVEIWRDEMAKEIAANIRGELYTMPNANEIARATGIDVKIIRKAKREAGK